MGSPNRKDFSREAAKECSPQREPWRRWGIEPAQWGGRRVMNHIPRLYAIVDAALFGRTSELVAFSEELAAGGCTLLQYRNKSASTRVMLEQARELRRHC